MQLSTPSIIQSSSRWVTSLNVIVVTIIGVINRSLIIAILQVTLKISVEIKIKNMLKFEHFLQII